MDNDKKKLIRRIMSIVGGILGIISLTTYFGLEIGPFNHWNPLFNPYLFIFIGSALIVARTVIKDSRVIGNFVDKFNTSGLVTESYEVDPKDIGPTHITYTNNAGEKDSVRISFPIAIPSKDSWDNEYLVPSSGVEALNPAKLVQKYGARLDWMKVTKQTDGSELLEPANEHVKWLMEQKIPEMQALDPEFLCKEMIERDDPDTLVQEATYHLAEIRKGWLGGSTTAQLLVYVLLGIMVGGMVFTLTFMVGKVDFSHISGMIRSLIK